MPFKDWIPLRRLKEWLSAGGKVVTAGLQLSGQSNRASGLPALLSLAATPIMKNALVVLDDLERRHKSLALREVLGTIIRLVDVRRCRVIVISNENELEESDRKELDQYREKVFDLEYFFNPSVHDTVYAFVDEPSDAKRILGVFARLELNNLRIVSRVYSALRDFRSHLQPGEPASERIFENVTKICAFRWGLGLPVEPERLISALGLVIRKEEAKENPLAGWIERTDFATCEADTMILEYLTTGRIDPEALKQAAHVRPRWTA